MRFKYKTQRYEAKLSEIDVETLMDPNHKMSAILAFLFWISWLPYILYLFGWNSDDEPNFEYWTGKCCAIWRLPILTMFFPRYRNYLRSFMVSIRGHWTPLLSNRSTKPQSTNKSSHPQIDDPSLHM